MRRSFVPLAVAALVAMGIAMHEEKSKRRAADEQEFTKKQAEIEKLRRELRELRDAER